jgi:hypothetical protein
MRGAAEYEMSCSVTHGHYAAYASPLLTEPAPPVVRASMRPPLRLEVGPPSARRCRRRSSSSTTSSWSGLPTRL